MTICKVLKSLWFGFTHWSTPIDTEKLYNHVAFTCKGDSMVKGSELHKAAIRYKRKMYNQELLKTSGALINTANGREDTIVFTFLGNQYSNNLKRKKAYSLKDARWQPYHISTIKKLQMIARNEVRKLHERMPKS